MLSSVLDFLTFWLCNYLTLWHTHCPLLSVRWLTWKKPYALFSLSNRSVRNLPGCCWVLPRTCPRGFSPHWSLYDSLCNRTELAQYKKTSGESRKLPWEHIIGCCGVELCLLKDVTITTTVTIVPITTVPTWFLSFVTLWFF